MPEKIYYFDPKKLPIKKGDHVIVETAGELSTEAWWRMPER